ncbi:NAD(P)-dependent methylenetetrahydromethanopterin dehydrogenase [Caldimonas tepidiphila]|uniref:NAD(P)-dependent methylenetetrahydromethanopterin dehydrogenase n=1 Tax=Caldimonas tepidiphila TaxID=2315841 RepID=UPI000E5B8E58|nr:NAD(P)-dependent methylenetetrahydromethanopterin dehydrogenase [Caldimonas tepidiphila]
MERPYILHMFTPGPHISPFDSNMAADAGWQLVLPYASVDRKALTGLTQDAIFSRGPKGVARTGIFIGGRDVLLAADMLEDARRAMVPPFDVPVFADPSGSYTTAAALVACVQAQLRKAHGTALADKRVLILGGTGTVGRIAGVLAAREGASVRLGSHSGLEAAQRAARETGERFGCTLEGLSCRGADEVREAAAEADVVLGTAAAGVQVLGERERRAATRLLVAADVNAVPPEGLAGVGVMDMGKPLPDSKAVGIGALAVGNVKYQVQHRLLARMRDADRPLSLGFPEAYALACEMLAEGD